MKKLHTRATSDIDGEFVVLVIGMEVNDWSRVRQWWSAAVAMKRMLQELAEYPELGLLRAETGLFPGGIRVIQYWRSYEALEAYARASDRMHLPAWRAYHRIARSSTAVGVYHETYRVWPGTYETVYDHMPSVGLLAAGAGSRALPAGSTSAQRMSAPTRDAPPVRPA